MFKGDIMVEFRGFVQSGKKRFAVVNVAPTDIVFGQGVTRRQAEKAYQKGFVESARPKMRTKYKGLSGFEFRFY